jgi:hypothetical protein
MVRTTKPTSLLKSDSIRIRIIRNAMAHNNCLSWEYLCFKTNEILLCFCHPNDREQFESELRINKLSS